MDRLLMEEILKKMKRSLQNGENIGDFKVGALFALGNQLEAIFYFVGHELGSKFVVSQTSGIDSIIESLKSISSDFHLGDILITEKSDDHITFYLENCGSCKDFPDSFSSKNTFCSFEAGLFAGIVEKITNKHCFAQELVCRLQQDIKNCQFMIVIPNDE